MKLPDPRRTAPAARSMPAPTPSRRAVSPAGEPVSPRDPAGPVPSYATRVIARGVPMGTTLRMVLPNNFNRSGAGGSNAEGYDWLQRNIYVRNNAAIGPGTYDVVSTHYDPASMTATWDLGTQAYVPTPNQTFASRVIVPGVGEGRGFDVVTKPGEQDAQVAPHPFALAFVANWPVTVPLALLTVNGAAPGAAWNNRNNTVIFRDPYVVLDRTRINLLQFTGDGAPLAPVTVAPFTGSSTTLRLNGGDVTLDNLASGARAYTARGDALENLLPFNGGAVPAGNDRLVVLWPGFAGAFGQWNIPSTGGRIDVDLARTRTSGTGARLRPYSDLRYARPELLGSVELRPLGNYVVSLAESEGGGAASVRSTGRGLVVQNLPRQSVNLLVRRGNTPGAQPIPLTVNPGTLDAPTVVQVPESVTAPSTVRIRLVGLPGHSIVRENGADVTSPGEWEGDAWVLTDRARTAHTFNVEYPDARGTRTLTVPAPVGATASVDVNAAPIVEVVEERPAGPPPVALVGLTPGSRVYEEGVDVTLPGEWQDTSQGRAWVLTGIAAGRHALVFHYPDGATREVLTNAPVPGGGTILVDARPPAASTGAGGGGSGSGGGGGGAGAEVETVDIGLLGLPDGSNVLEGDVDVTSPVAQRSYGAARAWTLLGRSRRSHTFTFVYPGGGTRTVTVDAPNVNESVVTVDASPSPAQGGTAGPSPDAGSGGSGGGSATDTTGFALVLRNLPAGAKVFNDAGEDVTVFGTRAGNDWTLLNVARGASGSRTFRVRYPDGTEYPLTVSPGAQAIVTLDAPQATPPAPPAPPSPPAQAPMANLVVRNIADGWNVYLSEVAPSVADLGRRQLGRSLALERMADGMMTGRITLPPGTVVQLRALPAASPAELGRHYWLRIGPQVTAPAAGETLTIEANGVGQWPQFQGGLVRVRDDSATLRGGAIAQGIADQAELTPLQREMLDAYIAQGAADARAARDGYAPSGYPTPPPGVDYEGWLRSVWEGMPGNDQWALAGRLANVPVTIDGVTSAIQGGRAPVAGQSRWERLAREFNRYVVRNGDRLSVPTGMPFWAFQRVTGTDWSLAELAVFAGYARRPLPTPAHPLLVANLAVVPARRAARAGDGSVAKLGLVAPGAIAGTLPKDQLRPTAPAGDLPRVDMVACAQRAWQGLSFNAQIDVVDRMIARDTPRRANWQNVGQWMNRAIAGHQPGGYAPRAPAPMRWDQLQLALDAPWSTESLRTFCEASGAPLPTYAPAPVSPLPAMTPAPVRPAAPPKGNGVVGTRTGTALFSSVLLPSPKAAKAPPQTVIAPAGKPAVGYNAAESQPWRLCVERVLRDASGWEQARIVRNLARLSRERGRVPQWQTLEAEYDRRRAAQQVYEMPPRLSLGELDAYLTLDRWTADDAAMLCDFVGQPLPASTMSPAPVRPVAPRPTPAFATQPVTLLSAMLPVKYRAAGDAPLPPPQWVVYASPGNAPVPSPTERDFLYVDSVVDVATGEEGERYFLGWVPPGPWNVSTRYVDYNPSTPGTGASDFGPIRVELVAGDVRDLTLSDIVRQSLLAATPGTAPPPQYTQGTPRTLEVVSGFRFEGLPASPNSDAQRVFIDGRAVTLDANGAVATTPGTHEVTIEPPGVRATFAAPDTGVATIDVRALAANPAARIDASSTPALKNSLGILGVQTDGRRCGPFAPGFVTDAMRTGAVPADVLGRVVCEFDPIPVSAATRARYAAGTIFAALYASGYGMVVVPMTAAQFNGRTGWRPYDPFTPPPTADTGGDTAAALLTGATLLAGAAAGVVSAVAARS